jgi:large subunit ribosomal protein L10
VAGLNHEEKAAAVAEVSTRLTAVDTVINTDYRGLTVKQIAELRGRLRDAEAEMTVVKNTLARRAADDSGRPGLLQYLEGPSGLVWVNGDPARAAKVLADFAREHPGVFAVKGGLMGVHDLPPAGVSRLASLPTRDQLLAQLAGGVASPLTGLASRMSNMIGGMARALSALRDTMPAAAEAPAPAADHAAPDEAPAADAADAEAPAAPEEAPPAEEAPPPEEPAAAEAAAPEEPAAEAAAPEEPAAEEPAPDEAAAPAAEAEAPAGETAEASADAGTDTES